SGVRGDAVEDLAVRGRDDERARAALAWVEGLDDRPGVAAVAAAEQLELGAGVDPARIGRIDGQVTRPAEGAEHVLPRRAVVARALDAAAAEDERRAARLRIGEEIDDEGELAHLRPRRFVAAAA